MRGEHRSVTAGAQSMSGSSPHARGAPVKVNIREDVPGLIPACAGSTRRSAPTSPVRRAHPRMRGEHRPCSSTPTRQTGSSPHARGALTHGHTHTRGGRLIPACAGSTAVLWCRPGGRAAHPRMRGEHLSSGFVAHMRVGSSPHARGAPRCDHPPPATGRLIPACAGSTLACRRTICRARAHPRMRGEHC